MPTIHSFPAVPAWLAISLIASLSSIATDLQARTVPYEIWGADQSNSRAADGRGTVGSWLWIWRSEDMRRQLRSGIPAEPVGCDGSNTPGAGPCDLLEVFPADLQQYDTAGATGLTLADLPSPGRLHGMLVDPQNLYVNINAFTPGTGYVGIVDGRTKEAVALFRVTEVAAGVRRSVHMSFWNADGSAILIANLHGKLLERIDLVRDSAGNILSATLNRAASLGVGKGQVVTEGATAFRGLNAHGNPMVSEVSGDYAAAALADLTPGGFCKENGCAAGADGPAGGRPNNVIICPIMSSDFNAYITTGGGGLLVADTTTTPMQLIGEYGRGEVNGAGCGGVEAGDYVWLNAGASAAGSGATQSTFTMYAIDDSVFRSGAQPPGHPQAQLIYKDAGNTATLGNELNDPAAPAGNLTGQLPGTTTRRDAHGATITTDGRFIHNVDRIQNNVEVFSTRGMRRIGTYDLTTRNGGNGRKGGPCAEASVADDPNLPGNDPAPDLLEATPDGRFLVVALRGPAPVTVRHAAQGSCPGVGIIRLLSNGRRGYLKGVLRTANPTPDGDTGDAAPGGVNYGGTERSDVHGASVRTRVEDL